MKIENLAVSGFDSAMLTVKQKGYVYKNPCRHSNGLMILRSGKIRYFQGGKTYVFDPHHVLLIPAGADYSLVCDEDSETYVINFLSPAISEEILSFEYSVDFGIDAAFVISNHDGDTAARLSSVSRLYTILSRLLGGGYAEYVAVKYDMLMPIPENCSMAEAAAIPEAFATAYLNLFIEGKIQPGNTLLMNAGASGLASVVIPMAKAFGIRVITTVIKDEFIEKIKHLGADVVVNTAKTDLTEILRNELDAGHPVDVAIDCLGGDVMGKCLHYLSHGARWIMIATLAGDMTQVDMRNIYVRNVRIIGSTLRSRTPAVKAQILTQLVQNVWDKVSSGEVKPTIYKILPITEVEEAHATLYRGENVGKVVLHVAD